MNDHLPSDSARLACYRQYRTLWATLESKRESVGSPLDDKLACFTVDREPIKATIGLDWLLSEIEKNPDEDPAVCRRLRTLLLFAEAAEIPDIHERLRLGAVVRCLRRNDIDTANKIAPQRMKVGPREFSVASLENFLGRAKMRRVIFPVVWEGTTGHLLWVEVFCAGADAEFPSGIHLAPWSFYDLISSSTIEQLAEFSPTPQHSIQVSFQPLRFTDFDGEERHQRAAAWSLHAPIGIRGPSLGFAVALATLHAGREGKTFRRVIATGRVESQGMIAGVNGATVKSAAVRDFWKMLGKARWFFHPQRDAGPPDGKFCPLTTDTKWRSVSSLDQQIDGLLSDGFDGYRAYLKQDLAARTDGMRSDRSLDDLLRDYAAPTVDTFNDSPEALARDLFDRLNSKLLAVGCGQATLEDQSTIEAQLPDQEIFILLPREQVPDCYEDLPKDLRKILVKKLEDSGFDPPEQSDIERKQTDGKLCLMVYTEPSFQFPADAAETRLSILRDLEVRGTRVILVCPDAHLRWSYEQTAATQTDGQNGTGGQSVS